MIASVLTAPKVWKRYSSQLFEGAFDAYCVAPAVAVVKFW
jgi:hypothetical protein